MVNSKNKGNRFELKIAKLLTAASGKKWHRVGMSGARGTNEGLNNAKFKGDVFCESSNIVIECKHYKNKFLLSDLFEPNGLVYNFVEQARREAGDAPWILFCTYDRGPVFMIYDIDIYTEEICSIVEYIKTPVYKLKWHNYQIIKMKKVK